MSVRSGEWGSGEREHPTLVGVVWPVAEAHKVAWGAAKPPEQSDAFRGGTLLTPGYLVLPRWGTVKNPQSLDAPVFLHSSGIPCIVQT